MKHTDIKVGEAYAYAQGKSMYNASQVIILDKAKCYRTDHNVIITMGDGNSAVSVTGYYTTRFYGARRATVGSRSDMLAALQIEVRVKTDIDPETGQPWTDEKLGYWHQQHDGRTQWVHSHFEWVPFVVSTRHVRKPWAVYQAEQAEQAAKNAERTESYRRQRVVSAYGLAQRQVEAARLNIANAKLEIVAATQALAEARQAALEAVSKRNRPLASKEVVSALLDPQDGGASLASTYVSAERKLAARQDYLARQQEALAGAEERLAKAEVPDPEWPEVTSQPGSR